MGELLVKNSIGTQRKAEVARQIFLGKMQNNKSGTDVDPGAGRESLGSLVCVIP